MKKFGIILAVIAIILLATGLLMKNLLEVKPLSFESIDMAMVEDGTYRGEADAGPVFVEVSVTVENHKMKDIEIIKHKNGMGSQAEAITGTMLQQNSYEVDAVSGATLSSDTIKSAVSKALKQGYAA